MLYCRISATIDTNFRILLMACRLFEHQFAGDVLIKKRHFSNIALIDEETTISSCQSNGGISKHFLSTCTFGLRVRNTNAPFCR